MYPATFQEYLGALEHDTALEALEKVPLPTEAFDALIDLFHRYAMVGGMPEVVNAVAHHATPADLDRIYRDLALSFFNDIPKYARTRTIEQVIRHCIETAPYLAGTRIKFQGFGQSNYRSREVGESLRSLERAMLLHLIYPSSETSLPFRINLRKSPRLQLLDIGLLNHTTGIQEPFLGIRDLSGLHQGRILEQVVGQELLAMEGPLHKKPLFWVREKSPANAEVDYVVSHNGCFFPVEVKSGPIGRLRSLHEFVERTGLRTAFRVHASPVRIEKVRTPRKTEFTLVNLPYFLASQIPRYIDYLG